MDNSKGAREGRVGTPLARTGGTVLAISVGLLVVLGLVACGPVLPSIEMTGTPSSSPDPTAGSSAASSLVPGPSIVVPRAGTEAAGAGPATAGVSSQGPGSSLGSARPPAGHEQAPQVSVSEAPKAPVWDAGSEEGARKAAVVAMSSYARPGVAAEAWRQDMGPLLTGRARAAWARMQPQFLTVSKVTGAAVLDAGRSNPYWIWVSVPTDDGVYRVYLNRSQAGSPWLVDRLQPAQLKH